MLKNYLYRKRIEKIEAKFIEKLNKMGLLIEQEEYNLFSFEKEKVGDYFLVGAMNHFDLELFVTYAGEEDDEEWLVAIERIKKLKNIINNFAKWNNKTYWLEYNWKTKRIGFTIDTRSELEVNDSYGFYIELYRAWGYKEQVLSLEIKSIFSLGEAEVCAGGFHRDWYEEYYRYSKAISQRVEKELEKVLAESRKEMKGFIESDKTVRNLLFGIK